ncbi:butyrophilin subfamily 2 member A2-like isoform X2 [Simochromis diagramma]|uniref:butyrophilin subfamily 2 member A2-like isoform X2 n=1 Tax=Simochromis diagramma TaxID=43689 RepID=UPI001A7E7E3B|nr:butyrophilin subfamily 2 member A2-like isoform X2 [Simochromis diagramma]
MIHQLINLIIAILLSAGTTGREDGVVTVVVSEGSDAILPCSLSTNQNLEQKLFDWKKDDQKEVFLYVARDEYNNGRPGQDEQFRGRVSHFPQELQFGNASIIIRNTRLADSGVYTCDFPHLQPEGKTFRIKLDVGVVTVVVSEGSDAILPCSLSTNQNLEYLLFDWRKKAPNNQEVFMYDGGIHYNNGRPGQDEHFRGRVSHFPQELQFGNASIIIRNTRLADSGVYTCDFPHLQLEGKTFRIKLDVELTLKDRSGEITGAAPKPDIRILNTTEDGLQLKCEVRGASPKPKVEWRDSDGNILPAEEPQVSHTGERYDITLLTTVTRTTTERFHCVATQEELSHKTDAQIYLHYQKPTEAKSCSPGVGSWIGGMCFGAISTLLLYFLIIKVKYHISRVSRRKQRPRETSEGPENGDTELTLKSEPV